jgi:transcriptional regulator with XRE-family HTH domain
MLGETVRTTRIKRSLTQARLARMAGVSRRHLAAREKGANVSINVLRNVASVLELTEISLSDELTVQTSNDPAAVNVPLLAETIREAQADAARTQSLLSRAETILGREPNAGDGVVVRFPILPAQRLDVRRRREGVADQGGAATVAVIGEIRQGEPVLELTGETAQLPPSLLEEGEVVFRARGDKFADQGIEDGDLLVVELRQNGRAATGELVVGKVGDALYIGRWWQKHGRKAILTDGPAEVTTGGPAKRSLKVLAAINAIVRPK